MHKTWRDLEEASLQDPQIRAAFALRSQHRLRSEQMLLNLVFALKAERDGYRDQLLQAKMHAPAGGVLRVYGHPYVSMGQGSCGQCGGSRAEHNHNGV